MEQETQQWKKYILLSKNSTPKKESSEYFPKFLDHSTKPFSPYLVIKASVDPFELYSILIFENISYENIFYKLNCRFSENMTEKNKNLTSKHTPREFSNRH